jgi:hypothetical protein
MALSVQPIRSQGSLSVAPVSQGSRAGQIYWKGSDGNIYLKGAGGNGAAVTNLGKASTPDLILNGAQEIADPNAPAPAQGGGASNTPVHGPSNPTGYTAPVKPDKSNDIALNQAGLGAVDGQTSAGIAAIDKALGTLNGQYDAETGANTKTYQTNTDTNQGNLQKNKQSAFVNAAQGRQGLFGTLSALGALNGSGIDLANNAVKHGVDEDLSGAADNFATNQAGLDTGLETYKREDKARRDNATLQGDNAKTNVQNDAARSKQNFFKNIANDYDTEGNAGGAKEYSDKAAALYPQVAATNVPNANLGYTAAAFNAPSLASYIAGAGGTQVNTAPTNPNGPAGVLPGLTAANDRKKQPTALV